MKRTIIIFLIISICVSLFACNRTENDESRDDSQNPSDIVVSHDQSEVEMSEEISEEISEEVSVEVSKEPVYVENISAAAIKTMDKTSFEAYATDMLSMIDGNITEIPEDFFFPETAENLPSSEHEYFAVMKTNSTYYVNLVESYSVFEYDISNGSFDGLSPKSFMLSDMNREYAAIELEMEKYKGYIDERMYEEAISILADIRIHYRAIEDSTMSQFLQASRSLSGKSAFASGRLTYHPMKFKYLPHACTVINDKNTPYTRMAIEWVYGYSSMTDYLGDGYAAALYPYGLLSICRYPTSYDVFDDHIMIETTLPILKMNIQETAGETTIPIDPYATGEDPARFRVRPNCAFDSAEILPIDEENEEVTFVLYDENGDEIKRITFNYMTYVFRETYPA